MDKDTEDNNQKDKLLTEAEGSEHTLQPSSLKLHTDNDPPNLSTISKKRNKKRRKKNRVKTEPANKWLQFLSEKRKLNIACDPTSKLDLKDERRKWWGLNEENKQVYKEKAVKEKVDLGDNFRNKSVNEERAVHEKTPVKKRREKKKCTQKKSIVKKAPSKDNQESLTTLMSDFKELEKVIDELESDVEALKNEKVTKMVDVATKKANLEHKSDSISVLKDKIANMNRIHIKCQDIM